MQELSLIVPNETGLHARPARLFAELTQAFKSDISIATKDRKVNAKSILFVISLGAVKGTEVKIVIDGEDEEQAKEAILELFENNLNE